MKDITSVEKDSNECTLLIRLKKKPYIEEKPEKINVIKFSCYSSSRVPITTSLTGSIKV